MLVEQGLVECDDGVRILIRDCLDGALLSVSARVVCGGDDNLLAYCPVKRVTSHGIQRDGSASDFYGLPEISPSHRSLNTMQLKGTVVDTNNFVAEDRQIGVVLAAMHGDCYLRSVAVFLSSNFHVATLDEDVMGIESSEVIWVRVRREDQRSLNVEE